MKKVIVVGAGLEELDKVIEYLEKYNGRSIAMDQYPSKVVIEFGLPDNFTVNTFDIQSRFDGFMVQKSIEPGIHWVVDHPYTDTDRMRMRQSVESKDERACDRYLKHARIEQLEAQIKKDMDELDQLIKSLY